MLQHNQPRHSSGDTILLITHQADLDKESEASATMDKEPEYRHIPWSMSSLQDDQHMVKALNPEQYA